MARFRFLGLHDPDASGGTGCQVAASGYLAVGFPSLHFVAPGDVFEVSDVKPVTGEAGDGNPVYGESDADAYRVVTARYEELPGDSSPRGGSFSPPPAPPAVVVPAVTPPPAPEPATAPEPQE